jgi:hypothetical protein
MRIEPLAADAYSEGLFESLQLEIEPDTVEVMKRDSNRPDGGVR